MSSSVQTEMPMYVCNYSKSSHISISVSQDNSGRAKRMVDPTCLTLSRAEQVPYMPIVFLRPWATLKFVFLVLMLL